MKKAIIILSLLFGAIALILFFTVVKGEATVFKDSNGIKYASMVDDKNFLIYKNGKWVKEFIKGVNMGTGKPGAFPGELAITEGEYLRWFKYISEMNADVIRVYTTMKPEFYNALYEFNRTARKPLYIMQGVWVNEEDIGRLKDAHNSVIKEAFKNDIKNLTDIIHGNIILPEKKWQASGTYQKDVSKYVVAWILGIEWAPEFVVGTNNKHPELKSFSGEYLYTQNASPFEVFLGEVGDWAIAYETQKYKMQRPVSFTNWVTIDPLKHPNEPLVNEDLVEVNTEHIKAKSTFKAGLFASYHIYPYYPDFMNYQKEYRSFIDKDGKINTYKAYLKDLRKEHTVPVLVAEFGVPAARGKAHDNIRTGFNQGNLDEKRQGEIDAAMLQDIFDEGYAGGVVFSWQDEWFKRTWNTMGLDVSERRPYWSNAQTNEQEFGLLAFDPGQLKSVSYVDGDVGEWKGEQPVSKANGIKLYVKSDEKYVYFMADIPGYDVDKDVLVIPLDTIQGQGNRSYEPYPLTFNRDADFVIEINGKDNSSIMVDSYYDSYYYIYAKQFKIMEARKAYETRGSGNFNKMFLCLNRRLYLPEDRVEIPFFQYETGKLLSGNGNPESKDFNSLTDFAIKDGKIEIRIPWQLLNVMDPSTKMIMGDFYKNNGITPEKIDGFYTGLAVYHKDGKAQNIGLDFYSWKAWEKPTYNERLKPSYYLLKKAFEEIGR